jgi:hypothetical protein
MFGIGLRRRRPSFGRRPGSGSPSSPAVLGQSGALLQPLRDQVPDTDVVPGRLRREPLEHLDEDPHGADGGYGVWSVYCDTSDLRSYGEKIEGLRFRRELRVRHHGT